MMLCPKCGRIAEFNNHFGAYVCLQKDCRYFKRDTNLTDEDKLYWNRQEGYERWELDNPVKNVCWDICGDIVVEWADGIEQIIKEDDFLKAVLKVIKKEIKK